MNEKRILEIAEAAGVEPEYEDSYGKIHRTSPKIAAQILEAKGVDLQKPFTGPEEDLMVVSVSNTPEEFSLGFDQGVAASNDEHAQLHLRLDLTNENGQGRRLEYSGHSFRVKDAEHGPVITAPFPDSLESGRYDVTATLNRSGKTHERRALWFLCPPEAYMNPSILQGRRISGVNIALYGVRSERNWGVGDFTDLKGIIDWAAEELMVDFVGLNPLHAIFNAQPYNTSPYNPSSRFYRNYLYLDVEAIPDFMESEEANEYVKKIKAQGVTKKLRDSEHVAYEEVSRLKLTVLGRLFKAFLQNHLTRGTDYASEFSSYERSQGIYLERFAIFSALREKFVSMAEPIYDWREWPDGLNDSRSDQVRRFAEENRNEVTFWKYLQWQIERQLSPAQQHCMDKGMMVGLYHDLALGVDGYGADAWAEPGFYLQDFSVGAPPDPFAPEGQNWGFPAPNGAAVRRAGYEPFLKMLNCGLDHGGAARIDHVMQLRRLFWIPKARPAKEGVYVSENESDLMNIIALQSCRERSIIVGEDLGTVPPDFREKMMEKGILSYRLFYFEEDSSGRMRSHHEYPRQALVSINTHDLPTFVGFWSERDIQTRVEIGQLSQEDEIAFRKDREGKKAKIIEKLVREGFLSPDLAHEAWESATPTVALHEAALSFLMRSPSYMVLINQEDALEDSRQQNLPGAVTERLNWVTKMRFSLEQLRSDPEALRLSERFRKLAIANHRAIRRAAD